MQNIKNDTRDETRDWDFLKDYASFSFYWKILIKTLVKE